MPDTTLTVSEFVFAAKDALEQTVAAQWVMGEVANFTRAASGHWYFSLRDENSHLDCVMLARQNRLAEALPKEGDKLAVFGAASLYAPRARFQLMVRFLRFEGDGAGRLYQLFVQRKQQWQQRGWFANARALPPFPRVMGIVCSTAGAALHDVLHILSRQWPLAQVIVYPAPAQGEMAAEKIAAMIAVAGRRRECDVLLVVRGGGGLEDLWAYNAEPVVSAIYQSPIPVISGIGHETDETLADYAADKSCPTPTAAAVAAVPEAALCQRQLLQQTAQLSEHLQTLIDNNSQRLDWAERLLALPRRLLAEKARGFSRAALLPVLMRHFLARHQQTLVAMRLPRLPVAAVSALSGINQRRRHAAALRLAAASATLVRYETALALLSPQKLLQRGYSIVTTASGEVVSCAQQLQVHERINIRVSDGDIAAIVAHPPEHKPEL